MKYQVISHFVKRYYFTKAVLNHNKNRYAMKRVYIPHGQEQKTPIHKSVVTKNKKEHHKKLNQNYSPVPF